MANYRHIYVHLPFCDVICHYCDFYTARSKEARHEELFAALGKEAELQLSLLKAPLEALYFGGGTPSVSPSALLAGFLETFRAHISPETEITLEANPANIHEENLEAWKAMGINRLSIGIQSLEDATLKRLGRAHNAQEAKAALALAKKFIPNLNGDLIYGVPGQGEKDPARHAREMVDLGASHISAYHLTIPTSHFLHPKLPPDTFAWEQIRHVAEELAILGLHHYEVSNFARPGLESRNNGNYWRGGPYLALGPSAHGFDGAASRWKNVADWEAYCTLLQEGKSPMAERETLSLEQRKIERLFTSLRTMEGLDLARFQRDFGENLVERNAAFFAQLEKEGLGTLANGKFVLTFAGRMLTDEVVKKLL
jgi:oxygen-independent coproporphyrinogen-3 oxidase